MNLFPIGTTSAYDWRSNVKQELFLTFQLVTFRVSTAAPSPNAVEKTLFRDIDPGARVSALPYRDGDQPHHTNELKQASKVCKTACKAIYWQVTIVGPVEGPPSSAS